MVRTMTYWRCTERMLGGMRAHGLDPVTKGVRAE